MQVLDQMHVVLLRFMSKINITVHFQTGLQLETTRTAKKLDAVKDTLKFMCEDLTTDNSQ